MEPQSIDDAKATTIPTDRRTEVHLIAAVDKNGLLSCDGRLPWEFKASGQMRAIADHVANRTVVVGYRAAIAMGGKPPGRQIIVLKSTPAQYRYSRARKTTVERRVIGLWKGCEVARSVDEVFARCADDSIYVIGGCKTFELFLPFATTMTCYVLQKALFDAAPPSPSNLYFPSMLREATLVDVGPDMVESRLTVRREQWRLDPVTLPPTRADAAARVKDANQMSLQSAPTSSPHARPVAAATTRASWFETTPVGAAVAKNVPPFQPAPVARPTANYTRHAYAALAREIAPLVDTDEEALREGIQASLIELGITSEMTAIQDHYKSMTEARVNDNGAALLSDCRTTTAGDEDDDDDVYDEILYDSQDDADNLCWSDDSYQTDSEDSDNEGDSEDTDDDDDVCAPPIQRGGPVSASDSDAKFDRWFHAVDPDDSTSESPDDDACASINDGLSATDDLINVSRPKLGHCPFAHLLEHACGAAALCILGCLPRSDVVRATHASMTSTRSIAELIAVGRAATTGRPMPIALVHAVLSCLSRTRSMTWTLARRVSERRGVSPVASVVGQAHPTHSDFSPTNARLYWTVPLDCPWPLRDMWALVECAQMHGREDIVGECISLFHSMDEVTHTYVGVLPNPGNDDPIALRLRESMGLGAVEGRLCKVLSTGTWAPPIRIARMAAKCRSVQLATAALDTAARHVCAGISLTRDGHCVLRLLAREPHDPYAHAAAAAHVVSTIVSGLLGSATSQPHQIDNAHAVDAMHALFDLIERVVCNEMLPAIDTTSTESSAKPPGDPAYHAVLVQVFATLCCTLVSSMVSPHADNSVLDAVAATRATCLLGRLVRGGLGKGGRVPPWLALLWPSICRHISDGRADIEIMAHAVLQKYSVNIPLKVDSTPADSDTKGANYLAAAAGHDCDAPFSAIASGAVAAEELEATDANVFLDTLSDGDPAVSAHVFGYLDAGDMGALARASRRAFLLVARMIMPRAGGRRPIIAGVCDRADIYVAHNLDVSALTTRSLDPLFDQHGNERDIQLSDAIIMVGHACWRLPSIRRDVAKLDRLLPPLADPHAQGPPLRVRQFAREIAYIEDMTPHRPYHLLPDDIAALIAESVRIESGRVADEALALACHVASTLAPRDIGATPALHFATQIAGHMRVHDAIVEASRHGRKKTEYRTLCVTRSLYLACAVARIAARHRSADLLHVACAMAVQACDLRTKGKRDATALVLLNGVIQEMEQDMPSLTDSETRAFLDDVVSCLGNGGVQVGDGPWQPDLATESGPPPAKLTSLSLRFFVLCAQCGPISLRCQALICGLAMWAL